MKIGFIGTGIMGSGIIANLLKADQPVSVFNRTKAHAQKMLDLGAKWMASPKALTAQSDVVFSMVGFPSDVETLYFGEDGILAGTKPGEVLVDMTTSTPTLAEKISAKAQTLGATALDAPVSGGDVGARNGTLTVMVGGDESAYKKLLPILQLAAKSIHRFGGPGKGQHAKMANQIMIAGTMTGLTEMLVYAKAAGLNLNDVLDTVAGGSGANWSMSNYGPRVIAGDYTPGFFVKHFVKDLRIALEEADKMGLNLPATQKAKDLYQALLDSGHGNLGTQGLITSYPSWNEK